MFTVLIYLCMTILVSVLNLAAYTSFAVPFPSFVEVALIGAIYITAVIISRCVKNIILEGGLFWPVMWITAVLILFPLAAGRLYMLSDGIVVTIVYNIFHWAWLIAYIILGLIPAVIYFIFHSIFLLTPMSEEIAFYVAVGISAIVVFMEGKMIAELVVERFGSPGCVSEMTGRAEIIDKEGNTNDIFFYK